ALDKRLTAIARTPNDPKPYIDLAEVAFHTSHMDMARQNMQKAVELAHKIERAATAPATEPALRTVSNSEVGELLTRLYRVNLTFAMILLDRQETDLRDEARFYFKQCQLTARTPEANAEWRLLLAPLTLAQQQYAQAASLYLEILTDSALRDATFWRGEGIRAFRFWMKREVIR
ncbi:MAG: hypothetical protein WCI73_13540, partial [Phycisphaerae bacterium]